MLPPTCQARLRDYRETKMVEWASPSCANCRFYSDLQDPGAGLCRYNPPSKMEGVDEMSTGVAVDRVLRNVALVFPIAWPDNWCGRWVSVVN